jgi:hypothetical protein
MHVQTRRETPQEKALSILNEELDKLRWTGAELGRRAKDEPQKTSETVIHETFNELLVPC